MPETTPLIPPGWEHRPNRTAMLVLDDGSRFTFKAPTLGELRKIAEAAEGASDAVTRLVYDLTTRQAELERQLEAKEITAADLAIADKDLQRELNGFIEQTWWEALTVAFDLLADKPAPDPTDAPAWLYSSAADDLKALLHHFKSSPPRRGPNG